MSITAAIHHDLLTWFKDVPVWQNEVFRWITAKATLNEGDMQDAVRLSLIEAGLEQTSTAMPTRLTDTDLPTAPRATGGSHPRLLSVHSLQNVNQLTSGQRINFGPSITLIYGSNGAGKSGYARMLKNACRCNERALEPVLGNVYQAAAGPVVAKIDLEINGTTQTLSWPTDTKAAESLRYFAVFDSKAARGCISGPNEVPCPPIFAKLETLGDVVKQVKERLARMAAEIQPQPEALKAFIDGTPTGKLIAQLNAHTPHHTLESAFVWTEVDEIRLTDLEKQAHTLKINGPQVLRKHLEQRLARIRLLRSEMEKVETALSSAKIISVQNQAILCRDLKATKLLAVKKCLGFSILSGAGSAVWEDLLNTAAEFFARHVDGSGSFPGKVGLSHCVLCQQKLDEDSHTRLVSFWSFLQDTAAVRLAEGEKHLSELTKPLHLINTAVPDNVGAVAAQLAEELPEVWPQVTDFFGQFNSIKTWILSALENGNWSGGPQPPDSLLAKCDAALLATLEQQRKLDDPAKAAALADQIASAANELSSRKRAAGGKSEILAHREKLHRAHLLKSLSDNLSTRSVSTKVSGLQKQYVTETFLAALQSEARMLGLRRAVPGLTPKTEGGRTTHTVTIAGVRHATPDAVFSEGERTALALAYFLVDIGAPHETPCAILDDPVTSLDHRIRTKVVERLCALSTGRQVVVFTHDLPFYCELKEKATHAQIPLKVQSVEAIGQNTGIIRDGDPVDAMKVAERETLLQSILAEARNAETAGSADDFAAHAFRFYSRLRSTWERAVEELLFNQVVQRFEKEVKTMRLTGAVLDDDAIRSVFAAMTKCSGLIDGHDHAIALNADAPNCDDMAADLSALTKFRSDHAAKRKAQEKRLDHLKT